MRGLGGWEQPTYLELKGARKAGVLPWKAGLKSSGKDLTKRRVMCGAYPWGPGAGGGEIKRQPVLAQPEPGHEQQEIPVRGRFSKGPTKGP